MKADDKSAAPVTPQRIMQLAWGYAAPIMIEAEVENKVFDALDQGPLSVEEISRKTGASIRGLKALLGGLAGQELIVKDAQGCYGLTPESAAFLVSGKPAFQGGFFRHMSSQLIPKWEKLSTIVKTGKPAKAVNQEGDGSEFFAKFVEDIFPMSYAAAQNLAGALGLAKCGGPMRVLDLAAGSGVWGIALAQASPHVTVTAVDWPNVLPITRQFAVRFNLANRFEYVAGDLLDDKTQFGTGHHIATLGHILHSEGAQRSRQLLKKTAAALAPGGTIAIAEFLPNDDRTGPATPMIFAVNMLVNTEDGDTFTLPEITSWLEEAGFEDVRTLDGPGPSPLVLATKRA